MAVDCVTKYSYWCLCTIAIWFLQVINFLVSYAVYSLMCKQYLYYPLHICFLTPLIQRTANFWVIYHWYKYLWCRIWFLSYIGGFWFVYADVFYQNKELGHLEIKFFLLQINCGTSCQTICNLLLQLLG